MKIPVYEAKFAVGPTIANVVRTFINSSQKDLAGIEMDYDTEAQLLRLRFRKEELYVGLSNIAWFKAIDRTESGSVSKETRRASASV